MLLLYPKCDAVHYDQTASLQSQRSDSIVPEVLWLVQMQVCKLKPCDQILWREDASCWQPLAAVLVLYFSVLS